MNQFTIRREERMFKTEHSPRLHKIRDTLCSRSGAECGAASLAVTHSKRDLHPLVCAHAGRTV